MLDSARMFPTEMIVGHDPETVFIFCRRLSDHAILVRGYLSYDFMVTVGKQAFPGSLTDRLRRIPGVELTPPIQT